MTFFFLKKHIVSGVFALVTIMLFQHSSNGLAVYAEQKSPKQSASQKSAPKVVSSPTATKPQDNKAQAINSTQVKATAQKAAEVKAQKPVVSNPSVTPAKMTSNANVKPASESGAISKSTPPKAPIVADRPIPSPGNPGMVQIYLKNGDDIKAQIIAYQPNKLYFKTPTGLKVLNLQYYHGLILDTPEEHTFGNSVTQNETVFSDAMIYVQKIRPLLNKQLQANLNTLPNVCKPKALPLLHIRFDKSGRVLQSHLLAKSDCPHLNLAIAQTVKQVKFPALPKDYPIDIYIFNYFFPPDLVFNPKPVAATTPPKPQTESNPAATLKTPTTTKSVENKTAPKAAASSSKSAKPEAVSATSKKK